MRQLARIAFAALIFSALPVMAQPDSLQKTKTTTHVRVIVTATSKKSGTAPPVVQKEDVKVRQEGKPRPVLDWAPAKENQAGLDLAILIDDSSDTSLGVQLSDLSAFIRSMPPSVRVAVAYAANGTFRLQQNFTADHKAAANALRPPFGRTEAYSSIYLSVGSLIRRWPRDDNRHEILLISSGIDLFRGVSDSAPGLNIDLEQAIRRAQRAGVVVYTLYADGTGRLSRNLFLINNGQGCLSLLAFDTGGESFFQGTQTPIAFSPFLHGIAERFGQQYVLTFGAQPPQTSGYERFVVTTELSGVDLAAPSRVFIPGAK